MRGFLVVVPLMIAVALHLVHVNADAIAEALWGAPPSFSVSRAPVQPEAAVEPTPAVTTPTEDPREVPAAPPVPAPLLGDRWLAATVDGLLANQPDLELAPEEVERLKDVYVYCQSIRTSYEAEIAEVLSITPTRARIKIPPYPEAGARLQQMWEEELTAELGEARSAEIDDHLGDTFNVAFKAFGAGAQLLEVDLLERGSEGLLYRIMARLDFADVSDPQLPMDDTRLFSTTGTYVLKPETVATGEWRPLAKHFPRLPDPDGRAP